MKTMYENFEGIHSELMMIDERSMHHKEYHTLRIPPFLRIKIKDFIRKKALRSLDSHLSRKNTFTYSYMYDFFVFFRRTVDDVDTYKALPKEKKIEFFTHHKVSRVDPILSSYDNISLYIHHDGYTYELIWYDDYEYVEYYCRRYDSNEIMSFMTLKDTNIGYLTLDHISLSVNDLIKDEIRKYVGHYMRSI